GRLWAQGPDGIRDTDRAKIWLAKAAGCGRPEAETLLAEVLLKEAAAGNASARGSAREHLKRACQAGEPGALYAMGCLLLDDPDEGRLLLVGPDQASALARAHSCMAGAAMRAHPDAALSLAKMYLDGTGCQADAVLASAWLKEAQLLGAVKPDDSMFLDLRRRIESALPESERERRQHIITIQSNASAQDSGAIERLAFMSLEGDGVMQDFAEAQRLFAEAAERGSENACEMVDKLNRSQSPHLQKRAEIDRKMAERGEGLAIENLAHAYENGDGVPKNYREASRWLLKAARQGRPGAQMRLGVLFENGRGVPQDQTCAALWFAESAKGGFRAGQFAYALRLLEGKGVPADPAEAFGWFEKAADQGSPYATDMMGHMLQEGQGVPADPERAFNLFRKASELGCDRSFLALGQALEYGIGTAQDAEAASYCYRKACQAGIQDACVRLACLLDDGRTAGQSEDAARLLQSVVDDRDCADRVRAQALYRLGLLVRDGRGIVCDPKRALDLLLEAADLGSADAREEAGRMLVAKGGHDAERGRRLLAGLADEEVADDGDVADLEAKAQAGDATSQCLLGAKYYKGEGCQRDYAKAAVWFEKAALQGDTIAQNNLGWQYQRGLGVLQDHEKAFTWYLKAAEAGLADAQNSVGWMLGEGLGCQKDEKAALAWVRKAAEGGSSIGQYNLGFSLAEGIGYEPDEKGAVQWFEKAAAAGHARAMYMLALILTRPLAVEPDPQRAAELFASAAEQGGLPEAMLAMGDMYRFGDGVETDFRKALEWYRKAAEKDDPHALFALAEMYVRGEGVEKDIDKAVEHCSKSADLGNADAQFQLGHLFYAPPEGRQQDEEQARSWLRKAAEQGHLMAQYELSAIERAHGDDAEASRLLRAAADGGLASAQNELGWRLCGDGATEQEYAQAVYWFEKAGNQDHAEALFNLGALYSRGDGVPEDHAKAAEFCLRAAELGYPVAQYVIGKFFADGSGVEQNLDEAARWLQLAVENGIEAAKQALVSVRSMQCEAVLAEKDGDESGGNAGSGGADGSAEEGGQ
nr:sel1 repeat family protein [Desulfovibrio sp.]